MSETKPLLAPGALKVSKLSTLVRVWSENSPHDKEYNRTIAEFPQWSDGMFGQSPEQSLEAAELFAQAPGMAATIATQAAQIEALTKAATNAKEKLALYRAQHSGEYIGSMEYQMLVEQIDAAIVAAENRK